MSDQPEIKLIIEPISREEARQIGEPWYTELVKGVVDVERGIIALGGEWHMDANVRLMAEGSEQQNVWGFNIYVDRTGPEWIEFVSLINIRPTEGNRTLEIESHELREAMRAHIERLIV